MMVSRILGGGAGLALGLAVMACEVSEDGPQDVPLEQAESELQRALCERVFRSCGCEQGSWYGDEQECSEEVVSAVDEIRRVLEQPGFGSLTYDPACMGEYVHLLDSIGCDPTYEGPSECEPPCLLVHGTRSEGQPCELYGELISDCSPGLRCFGTCEDPCGDGNGSGAGLGQPCTERGCDAGLLCDFGATETCLARPGVGERCVQNQCEQGAFCDTVDPLDPMSESRCFGPRAIGESCRGHAQCASEYCPAGFCAEPPDLGEPCAGAGVCASGLACIDDMCEPSDAFLCVVSVPYA